MADELVPPDGVQVYVYGAVPPVTTVFTLPIHWPLQGSLAVIVGVIVIEFPERFTTMVVSFTGQLASFTVME